MSRPQPRRRPRKARRAAPRRDRRPSTATPADAAWREALEKKLRLLPRKPGVYLLKDERGRTLYVGKAKRLPNRVRSYFRAASSGDPRIDMLRQQVRDLDYIVTNSETEALLLEASLVKSQRPRYNVELKDDKRYPYLRINVKHPFPRVEITRRIAADGARYFGPFVHVKNLRKVLRTMRQVFQLRACSDHRLKQNRRECLDYFIGLCRAPCTHRVGEAEYRGIVDDLVAFLDGRGDQLLVRWTETMHALAAELRFEESARMRDDIARLEQLAESQRMVDPQRPDLDAVGLVTRGEQAAATIFSSREGAIVGTWRLTIRKAKYATPAEMLEAVLLRHYQERHAVPPLVLVSADPPDPAAIEAWLTERAASRVRLHRPQRGTRARLMRAALENAHYLLEERELIAQGREQRSVASVYALQEAADLPEPPHRIEGYDISNLQGGDAVGSQVLFVDGHPRKSGYRRYRIRSVSGADDFAMLAEVLTRRIARLKEEKDEAPDLILIDGGRGQVSRVATVLEREGFGELPLIGIAKKEELLFARGARIGLRLPRSSNALQLLQRVRDEAHRFALAYHRKLRRRFLEDTPLDRVPGLGPKRVQLLLAHFGSLEALRRAAPEAIQDVPGIGPDLAARIATALGEEA